MRHVIIGASAAGIAAAKTIREIHAGDEIVMVSTDNSVYSRCMLHKYISHERNEQSLSFIQDGFFDKNSIIWYPGETVLGIDSVQKKITTPVQEIGYDKLLIAAGAESVIPPVGELRTAGNVYGLRHLSDAKAIDEKAAVSEHIAVIGSGLVGLDAVSALAQIGKKVTVIEMETRIMALQLDKKAAKAYQDRFELAGVVFKLGRRAENTITGEGGMINAIVLDNGERVHCDMVIVAAGVRPATAFLEGSGIKADRFVQVDDCLMTSVDGIYAAGDITGLSGIWPNARKQGEVAAQNMCGIKTVYTDRFALKNTVNFFGLTTLSIGDFMPSKGDEVLLQEDRNNYRKIVLRGNTVAGILFQGNISNTGIWQQIIKNKMDVSGIKKPLWHLSFADFYDTAANGEYRWLV